jgi:hypothetical protein
MAAKVTRGPTATYTTASGDPGVQICLLRESASIEATSPQALQVEEEGMTALRSDNGRPVLVSVGAMTRKKNGVNRSK